MDTPSASEAVFGGTWGCAMLSSRHDGRGSLFSDMNCKEPPTGPGRVVIRIVGVAGAAVVIASAPAGISEEGVNFLFHKHGMN